jgi:hypothetical protein
MTLSALFGPPLRALVQDAAIFVIDLQDANKNNFLCLSTFWGRFTSFIKGKKSKEVTKQYRNQGFSYYFCLMTEVACEYRIFTWIIDCVKMGDYYLLLVLAMSRSKAMMYAVGMFSSTSFQMACCMQECYFTWNQQRYGPGIIVPGPRPNPTFLTLKPWIIFVNLYL